LVGPFLHPGGGVFGAGRATAMRMFEHLGMDFEKVATGESQSAASVSLPAAAAATAAARAGATAQPAPNGVTLYGPASEELMTVRSIEREGDDLVVKGHAYGTMPITLLIRPQQARQLFKLLRISLLPFLVSFLFRRGKPSAPQKRT
jgi:hypothetical protein